MSAKCIVLVSCVLLAAVDGQANGQTSPFFRKDYEYDKDSKAFYKQHTTKRKWGDAVFTCTAEGAQLAIPQTEVDQRALLRHLKNGTGSVYLGIHDLYTEGDFITLNGIPAENIYMNWRQYEPNDSGGIEDCVEMIANGLYNDANCDTPRHFICKKDLSTLTANSVCETYDTEYNYSTEADRCYKFHITSRSWNDAYKICLAEESHLGIINSADEANIFVDFMKQHPEESLKGNFHKGLIHVGFNDLVTMGDFKTIDGKTLSEAGYEEWASGQPDSPGSERCGSMYRDGKLNDVSCQLKATFICEKHLRKPVQLGYDIRFGQVV